MWSVSVLFHKQTETRIHEVTVIKSSISSTEANRPDPELIVTPPPQAKGVPPKLDHWSRRREVNLKFFECRSTTDGYFCFSSDFGFCIHGVGAVPTRRVIVQRLSEHPYDVCVGKPMMEVVGLAEFS